MEDLGSRLRAIERDVDDLREVTRASLVRVKSLEEENAALWAFLFRMRHFLRKAVGEEKE